MMTKICSLSLKKLFVYIIIFSLALQSFFSQDMKNWTVAAEKFSFAKGQTENSITDGIAESIPKNILENLNHTLIRNIKSDESLERNLYELRTKRQSLYLQLSSEYKKRDSLVLTYTDKKLEKKIKEQEEKIEGIKLQIDENLQKVKEAEEAAKETFNKSQKEKKKKSFFRSLISNEKTVYTAETIKIYNNNPESLFIPSEEAKKSGYDSSLFEKEIYGQGINSLITGNISSYGGYFSVSVDLYLYPGAEKIGSVMEVGSFNDLELITSSIVRQLIPIMTNSLPVEVIFSITPTEILKDAEIYIDDVLQKTDNQKIIINSGVHTFKVVSKGYSSLSTSYFFEGNKKYKIEANMTPEKVGNLFINLKSPLDGKLYANGQLADKIDKQTSKIIINGNEVLGQFISENGHSSFFYVPEELYYDENFVTINPKPEDRSKKIDVRRRWMYGAYSAFMVSLIPTFITKGVFFDKAQLYYDNYGDYETAKNWQIASNVCLGISIGLGIFWGFELVRYLIAANSVLPEKAKEVNLIDYNKYKDIEIEENNIEKINEASVEKTENIETGDN